MEKKNIKEFTKVIVFFIVFISFITSYASPVNIIENNLKTQNKDKNAYDFIFSLCTANRNNLFPFADGLSKEIVIASHSEVLNTISILNNSLRNLMDQKIVSSLIVNLLKYPGFFHALNDCYGSDNIRKKQFIIGLALSDLLGKTTSVIQMYLYFKAIKFVVFSNSKLMHFLNYIILIPIAYFIVKELRIIHDVPTEDDEKKLKSLEKEIFTDPNNAIQSSLTILQFKIVKIDNQIKELEIKKDQNTKITIEILEKEKIRLTDLIWRLNSGALTFIR